MRRDRTTRFCWVALWLLSTLASLFHLSLGAPAQTEQPSEPTESTTNTSNVMLKQIENAFRNGSTVKNILKTLESVGGEVDLRELSKAVVTHVLSAAENGQMAMMFSGDELPTSPETKKAPMQMPSDEIPETDASGSEGEEVLQDTEVTIAPQTTRTQRQTTPITTGSPQGGATLPAIPASAAGVRITEATAATIRWLDASKKMDSVTSTPMPEKEDEGDQVADSPTSSNASLVAAIDDREIQQETTTLDEESRHNVSSDPGMEDESMTTEASEEFKGDDKSKPEAFPEPTSSDSEVSEPVSDTHAGAAAIEPATSPEDPGSQDSEDSGNPERRDEGAAVTALPTTEPREDTETETTEMDFLDEEEIPYDQDQSDYLTGTPFNPHAERTATTAATSVGDESTDVDSGPVTTAASVSTTSETKESDEEVSPEEPEENVTESNQSKDGMLKNSTEKPGEESTHTQASGGSEGEIDDQQQMYPSDDTAELPVAPSTSLSDTLPVAADSTTTAPPSAATSAIEPDTSFMEAGNPAAAVSPPANRSSTVVFGADPDSIFTPTTRSDSPLPSGPKPGPMPVPTTNSTFRQPPPTDASSGMMADPQTTLEGISRFQAPLRLLLINKLGTEFARLTQVFRRPNLTDPLPDISAIVSEVLSNVRVQHLRSPTKRNAAEQRDALQLSVNGVRVDVNVTRQPNFVQNGPTTVNHVSIDRRRMFVWLHLHFHNVSVPLNFSVAADLFPPFFSVRRSSGEAHVEVDEVLVPLRIPFKLYFQKNEGEAAASGVLMPEDFVIHGASMLNVSTHFADCGERDFMEKEVLRFEEHLKNCLELWLSHEPLTSLTDTLRSHLLVASRRPATMRLARGVGVGTLITDATTPRTVTTSMMAPNRSRAAHPLKDMLRDEAEDLMDQTFGIGD